MPEADVPAGPSEGVIEVRDPRHGSLIATVPAGGDADAQSLVAAAVEAAPGWARTSPANRAELIKDGARRLRAHSDELAELQAEETGKPLGDSLGGVMAGISALEQYAELGPLHRGRSLQGEWSALDVMVHEPRGVAVLLVPWNDPVAIGLGLAGASLVSGNATILKPSEMTPLATRRAVEIMDLPPAVLAVALGDEHLGRPLVAHPSVDVVVHVGSVATGREIASVRALTGSKTVLELGGKDALIIDEGVDPRWAAEQAALGAFANAGQICTSVERIYVHSSVAEQFVKELSEIADAFDIGPMIDGAQRSVVQAHVEAAVVDGARILCGGSVPDGPGYHYPPTVIVDVAPGTVLMRDETFGPVAAVAVVDSFADAIEAANDSRYGLAATVLTGDQAHAQEAWRSLRVGTVKINAVFGGAPGGAAEPHAGSGLGFGYGPELLDELCITKVVHYRPAPAPASA